MKLRLEFDALQATLVITEGNGDVTEVRGNAKTGAYYSGDTLDRLIGALPRMVNVSSLFADDTVHLRNDWARDVRAFLANEERLRGLVRTGKLKRDL